MAVARPTTKAELILNLKYQMRLHLLHYRLFRRIRGAFAIVIFLGGSWVVVSKIQAWPTVMAATAISIAVIGILEWYIDPASKAAQHAVCRAKAADVLKRGSKLDNAELHSEVVACDTDLDVEFESLRTVAFNDVLRSSGYEDGMRPETALQRTFRFIA